MRLPVLLCLLALGCMLGIAPPAVAQSQPAPEVRAEAKQHFTRGIDHFKRSDYRNALVHFEKAYALLPYSVVAFNIALSHAELSEPVEAVAAMKRALKGEPALDDRRSRRAREIIAEQEALISKVAVKCNVAGAKVLIDDQTVGVTPIPAEVVIARGEHFITAQADGYLPAYRALAVAAGGTTTIDMELQQTDKPLATVKITSAIPGAEVFLDGTKVARTPIKHERSFGVAADTAHRIELRRPGYVTRAETITLGPSESAELVMNPDEDRQAIANAGSELQLSLLLPGVTIYVNGIKRTLGEDGGTLPIAPGPHHILAERDGYASLQLEVSVAAGQTLPVQIDLPPTEATRFELVDGAETQRLFGWLGTIGGAALTGAAVGVLIWNTNTDGVVSEERRKLNAREAPYDDATCTAAAMGGQTDVGCPAAALEISTRENRVTGFYVGSAVALAVGGGALITGIALLATGEDPDAFRVDIGDDLGAITFTPYAGADPSSWSAGLRGSF